ncbi:MAG: HEAT repeat domain-containing protein [Deltaproteobacteria bacterium]|nr:HEAT repeat domain-containing protein [bacterium]MCB9476671.1 HEAT repeat domain-containing protein [Deltaproteobacteria bacterium]MCB9479618.1 HEAT repeat domain-containing protein [Deltaproteobacteria bacterium]MCB9488854.1 HEAT repeat domain-containing protein [Deltaproteobacteria bacterium]
MASVAPGIRDSTPVLSGFASLLKKARMYPVGHPTLSQSLDDLVHSFERYFKSHSSLSIGVGQDRLYVDDQEVRGQDWIDALSRSLHQHSVSHVTFHRGVDQSQLTSFLKSMELDPFDVKAMGGYQKMLSDNGVHSIHIIEIDYHLDEEDLAERMGDLSDAEVWRRIANSWRKSQTFDSSEDQEFVSRMLQDAPRLAALLDSAIAATIDANEMAQAANDFFSLITSMPPPDTIEERNDHEARIVSVLEHLSPRSRYIILQNTAIAQMSQANEAALAFAPYLDILSDRDIGRSLFEGLDPTLCGLDEFCMTYKHWLKSRNEPRILSEISALVGDLDPRHDPRFGPIMDRCSRTPRFNAHLRRLAETIESVQQRQSAGAMPVYQFLEDNLHDIPELASDVNDARLEEEALLNLLDLLESQRELGTYEFYAHDLGEMIVGFVHTGRYALADRAMRLLRKHASTKNEFDGSRKIARAILMSLRRPEVAEALVSALHNWGREEAKAIGGILTGLGSAAYEPILRSLDDEQDRGARHVLIDILSSAGTKILPAIAQALENDRWYVVRNMIAVIGKMKPEGMDQLLSETAAHDDARVRKETARALGGVGSQRAVELLIDLMHDKDPGVRQQAILGLGSCAGSRPAAEALRAQLSEKHPFDDDEKSIELAIESLGYLKDGLAVSLIEKYLLGTGLLKRVDEQMLTTAAKALANIGDLHAKNILTKGSKSLRGAVKRACSESLRGM